MHCKLINEAVRNKMCRNYLKLPDITEVYKNLALVLKSVIDQLVFHHYYQKYLKKLFMTSFMNT